MKQDKSNPRLYAFLYRLLAGLIRRIHCVRVEGLENEPADGAYLACPNHLSNFDVLIVAASLRRRIRFFAKAELFRIPVVSQIISALGAYPISRGTGDVAAVRNTISLLQSGEVVGLFPQGTRYIGVDPRNTPVRHGMAMIAFRTGVPVLPICIETKGFRILPFRRVDIRIGKPVTMAELGMTQGNPEEYKRCTEAVFERITSLLVCEKTGEPVPERIPASQRRRSS